LPYCPKCRFEFPAGRWLCSDCNEKLVDLLPEKRCGAVQPDDSWVVIGSVVSHIKADMARGTLDSNNIPSVILSSSFTRSGRAVDEHLPLLPVSDEGRLIMVPREFRGEAQIILETILGDDLVRPEFR